MTVFNDIQNCLNEKLSTVGSIPVVYYPNSMKEPTQGTDYVRPTLIPARSALYTLVNENMHMGIYQIDIFTVLKKGTSEALSIADTIRNAFNRQSLVSGFTTVHTQQISISQARRIEGWWSCYVEIYYLCVA